MPKTRKVRAIAIALVAGACSSNHLDRTTGELVVAGEVDFGPVAVGLREVKSLSLRNVGAAPLSLTHIAFQAPAPDDFAAKPLGSDAGPSSGDQVLAPGATTTLALAFAPSAVGQRGVRLLVQTDSTTTPEGQVDLHGTGVLAKADLDPTALDFGSVPIHATADLRLTLTNPGSNEADVTVGPLSGDDAQFFQTFPSGAMAVAPGQKTEVTVRFSPMRTGPHLASLAIRQCPSCALTSVSLQGIGIAAALMADPTSIDFGSVQPGQQAVRQTRLTNVGSAAVVVQKVELGSDTTADDSIVKGPTLPLTLSPGDGFTVSVQFAPTSLASEDGTLRITYQDPSWDTPQEVVIGLTGHGGGPLLQAVPSPLGFPSTAVSMSVDEQLVLRNAGTERLEVSALSVTGGVEFTLPDAPQLPLDVDPGGSMALQVRYSPLLPGNSTATLQITSNDPASPTLVPLTGSAASLGPCSYRVVPQQLDFGSVGIDTPATLSFGIRNVGQNVCAIANVRTSSATPPQFTASTPASPMIQPGATLDVPVTFTPDLEGNFTGEVDFDVSNPSAPQGSVIVLGVGTKGCLAMVPDHLDFGLVGLACAPPTQSVEVVNDCQATVNVQSISIGTGASDAFSIDPSAAASVSLTPGTSLLVPVTYRPTAQETDSAPLFIATDLSTSPFLVPLSGEAAQNPRKTDTFVIPNTNKVDFLFVIDNSGSMTNKQESLATNFGHFIDTAIANGTDFHIAVTTTGLVPYRGGWTDCPGGAYGGEDGRFFPVDNSRPRVLTPTTPDLKDVFAQNVMVGECHWDEQGLEGMKRALSSPLIDETDDPTTPEPNDGNAGFLRPDASLYVLWVTDADDGVDGSGIIATPESYVQFLEALKPGRPDLVTASGVIGLPTCQTIEGVGTRYMQVINAMGGIVADICSPDWSGIMDEIGKDAFSPRSSFPLSQASDGTPVTVTVDGIGIPSTDANGEEVWHFDSSIGANGAVVFDAGHLPPPGATVQVTYNVPCPAP